MSIGPTTATGTRAAPVRASVALANGSRSWSKTWLPPSRREASSSWRARMESGSFFRGQRRSSTGVTLRLPRTESGKPAGHVGAVGLVVVAEPSSQTGLLHEREVDGVHEENRAEQDKERHGAEERGLAEENREDAGDHRVPDVPVRAGDDEPRRRVPGGERALADSREERDRPAYER